MTATQRRPARGKISAAFSARLHRLDPDETVRAIVLLASAHHKAPMSSGRQAPDERERRVRIAREAAVRALDDVDRILQRYGGRRVVGQPNALGTIAVEASPAGITALARSRYVRAIMEDQPVSLAGRRSRV